MGWAHFNEDRFLEAADAFRAVLDLYALDGPRRDPGGLEGEAEAVPRPLARRRGRRAGVRASTSTASGRVPTSGACSWRSGQHFRRYGLLAEAAAVDELCLERYPLDADALLSARRLIETLRSARTAGRRRARRGCALAPRFAPGSAWAKAQASDSVRAAGAEFARASWKRGGARAPPRGAQGRLARTTGARRCGSTRRCSAHAGPTIPTRPRSSCAPARPAHQLGDYAAALAHYAAAARSGATAWRRVALWQRVAVTDALVREHARAGAGRRARSARDSLARAVLDGGGRAARALSRASEGRGAARGARANLAFAHGWHERAATDFGPTGDAPPDRSARCRVAASLRADALFRLERLRRRGCGVRGRARRRAQSAGVDSLARRAERAIPVCALPSRRGGGGGGLHRVREARGAVRGGGAALAAVRARARSRSTARASRSSRPADARRRCARCERWSSDFPKSEYVRDATLQIAHALEAGGERERARPRRTSTSRRASPTTRARRDAWLEAADLLAAAGARKRGADGVRGSATCSAIPEDVETAMEILESAGAPRPRTRGWRAPRLEAARPAGLRRSRRSQRSQRRARRRRCASSALRLRISPSTCSARRRIRSSPRAASCRAGAASSRARRRIRRTPRRG